MADRTCIVTGVALPRDQLIRIVSGPGGMAVVDLAEKLPGRGVWVSNSADALRLAADRKLLKRAIDAQFGDIEDTLQQVGVLMRSRAVATAAMARRAGALMGGAGKLAAEGVFQGLLAAPDASEREFNKLASRLEVTWTSRALDAEALGQICGRPSLAFAAIRGGNAAKMAEKLRFEVMRLERFYTSSACHAR
jgi:predicted RNA-binding protein YlxR (DUF448 family)